MDGNDCLLFANHPLPGAPDYLHQPVYIFVDEAYHARMCTAIGKARETSLPQHFFSDGTGPDGETSHYSNWIVALQLQNEQACVLAFISTDITHLDRVEEELEVTDTTLRSLVSNSPDGILIINCDREILFMNRAEYGFTRSGVLGVRLEMLLPEVEREKVLRAVEYVLRTGEVSSFDSELDTAKGHRYFSSRLAPISREGHIDRLMLVATDITARRESEQEQQRLAIQLQQAQKMEAIGQLTGGVAHDFNNLLTAIDGNLELAALDVHDPDMTAVHLGEALAAVHKASTLTQSLLAYSRKQALHPQAVDAYRLIQKMQNLLSRTLGETVRVGVSAQSGLWLCRVDPGQLETAIINLAVNARDAMERDGELTIHCSNSKSDGAIDGSVDAGDCVCIDVRDTGTGMSTAVAARAFDPFFTTKDVGRGSGLGLSMVHGLVNQSGGHLMIDSQPGEGTSVRMYLPQVSPDQTPNAASRESVDIPKGEGQLILVVEDEEQLRSVSARLVQSVGYRTVVAEDAEAAFEQLAMNPDIALVLSDVVLPGGIDGFEMAERARVTRPNLRVLFVSGYPQDALASHGQALPVAEVLPKPYSTAELARALHRAL